MISTFAACFYKYYLLISFLNLILKQSYAVAAANQVFVSGQVGVDPATSTLVTGGIEQETDRVKMTKPLQTF